MYSLKCLTEHVNTKPTFVNLRSSLPPIQLATELILFALKYKSVQFWLSKDNFYEKQRISSQGVFLFEEEFFLFPEWTCLHFWCSHHSRMNHKIHSLKEHHTVLIFCPFWFLCVASYSHSFYKRNLKLGQWFEIIIKKNTLHNLKQWLWFGNYLTKSLSILKFLFS